MKSKLASLFLLAFVSISPSYSFERGAGYWTTPADESSSSFFKALTAPESQRENWYAVTAYIAEFWPCPL